MVDDMGMQSSFMPSTLAHNLNDSVSRMQKMHRHLQTGERLIESSDNPGDFAVKAKLNMRRANSDLMGANVQNTVSFLQVLQRMAELKTQQDTISATDDVNDMYNYEFKELQGQLSEISQSKFNGISLFSDQMPKVLFGDSIGTDHLKPETHENQKDNAMNLTRWGMYRALSKSLAVGDKRPKDYGVAPAREILGMVFTNESVMDTTGLHKEWSPDEHYDGWKRSYHDHGVIFTPGTHWGEDTEDPIWIEDRDAWINYLGSSNNSSKLGIVTQSISDPSSLAQTALIPDHWGLPGVITEDIEHELKKTQNIAVDFFQNNIVDGDGLVLENEGATPDEQLANFQNAFHKLTNNGEDLPDVLVLNVDNSKSMGGFKELNEGVLSFKSWVETTYPKVFVSNHTSENFSPYNSPASNGEGIPLNENGYFRGIRINEGEDYIRQGRLAIEDAAAEYEAATGNPLLGTLDNDKSGVKGLMGGLYDLEDFDSSDFVNFIEKLTEAMAVNGAETSRATSELEELNTRQLGLEKSMENIDGLDF